MGTKFSVEDTIQMMCCKSMPIGKQEKGKPWIVNGRSILDSDYDFIYGKISLRTGQFFLYEKLVDGAMPHLTYPKLGIYLNELPCDQTIEIEWFDVRRSWEHRKPCLGTTIHGKEYDAYACDRPSEISSLILWSDSMNVYGAWDSMPGWKELRRAYEKTIWFNLSEQEKRDRNLSSILK